VTAGVSSFTDFCTAIQTAIGPGGSVSGNVQIYEGRQTKHAHASPPCIFLYPGTASYGGPMGAGAATNPRILHTRQPRIEAHCWGTDYANAEGLQNALITATRQVVSGANYNLLGDQWFDEGVDVAGVSVTTTFEVRFGVPEVKLPLAPMLSAGDMTVNTLTTVAVSAIETSAYAVSDHA
jgi:hypothetical protein